MRRQLRTRAPSWTAAWSFTAARRRPDCSAPSPRGSPWARPPPLWVRSSVTGITFTADLGGVRHLGIPLSRDESAASEALYQGILAKVQARVGQWAGHHLSFMGRAYIAKQILMSLFTYHAIFIPVPRLVLRQLSSAIYTFVAANRPAAAGQAYLFPRREVCSLDIAQGGINLLAIPEQITALRAKVIGRLMEPEQLPWKAYFDHHMYRTRAWLATAGPAATAANLPHVWQLGRFLIFSSLDLRRASLPPRVQSYIAAYRLLAPHRIVDPCGLPHDAIMREPLFHNRRICDPGTHLPLAWHEWAREGVVRMQDLRAVVAAPPHQVPPTVRAGLPALLAALPEAWAAALQWDAPLPEWLVSSLFFFFFFFARTRSAQYKTCMPGGRMRPNLSTHIPDRTP